MYSEYHKTISKIDSSLCIDENFDLIKRELVIANKKAVLYFIDGFIKDEIYEKILEYWFGQTPESLSGIKNMDQFSKRKMPYVEVSSTNDITAAKIALLSGPAVMVIEGISGMLIIDTRTYPMRGIEEPDKDKSLRGSKDGFVETLVMNTAMIRRRIRDERLRMEYMQIGQGTKLDIVISFIDGLADERVLKSIRERLSNIKLDGISMTQQALSEALIKTSFFNPFPKFKFSQRPDYISASILEGKIAVIMDNSPAVMLLPTSYNDFFREVDDYYFPPLAGTYTRIVRLLVNIITVIGTPLYLLVVNNPQYLPKWLVFIKPTVSGSIPLFVQLLILEFIIDGLRLASLNTPSTLSSSFGIIGGLLLSEFAVSAGWFITEAILFMSFITIASFTLPSFEMGYAMKFERLLLLVLVQLFGLWGLIAGVLFITVSMFCLKTITGRDYMYPIIPFNAKDFVKLFIRPSINKDE